MKRQLEKLSQKWIVKDDRTKNSLNDRKKGSRPINDPKSRSLKMTTKRSKKGIVKHDRTTIERDRSRISQPP